MNDPALPRVWVNVAITADGKLAPDSRHFVPFSSKRDQQLMMELRSRVDAVISGARTVDLGKVDLGPGGRKYEEQRMKSGLARFNLRVIASGSASIKPSAHIFKTRFSPILLLTTEAAPKERIKRLVPAVDDIFFSPGATLDFRAAFAWLRSKWKVGTLLCEGGGEVNAPIIRGGLADTIYVTICPVLFGGRSAPTLADGTGITNLSEALPVKLVRRELINGELYCVFRRAS
jgi:2,5-diamino-6-(ribosylamino)-4(3H)-pyrimidinone 5'-phosphate reductase